MDHQRIFLSYSHKDETFAYYLRNLLEDQGFDVWMDSPRIGPGEQWWGEIQQNIEACAAFMVVMSSDSRGSEWVQREVMYALHLHKPIFPVLLSGEIWPLLLTTQAENMTTGLSATLSSRLVRALEAVMIRAPARAMSRVEQQVPAAPHIFLRHEEAVQEIVEGDRRSIWSYRVMGAAFILLGVMVIAVLLALGKLFGSGDDEKTPTATLTTAQYAQEIRNKDATINALLAAQTAESQKWETEIAATEIARYRTATAQYAQEWQAKTATAYVQNQTMIGILTDQAVQYTYEAQNHEATVSVLLATQMAIIGTATAEVGFYAELREISEANHATAISSAQTWAVNDVYLTLTQSALEMTQTDAVWTSTPNPATQSALLPTLTVTATPALCEIAAKDPNVPPNVRISPGGDKRAELSLKVAALGGEYTPDNDNSKFWWQVRMPGTDDQSYEDLWTAAVATTITGECRAIPLNLKDQLSGEFSVFVASYVYLTLPIPAGELMATCPDCMQIRVEGLHPAIDETVGTWTYTVTVAGQYGIEVFADSGAEAALTLTWEGR